MKWLKTRLNNWLRDDDSLKCAEPSYVKISSGNDAELRSAPLRLNIYYAAGGVVIETRMYDRVKDRENNRLHIIHSDQNMSEELSKIITMETLRNT